MKTLLSLLILFPITVVAQYTTKDPQLQALYQAPSKQQLNWSNTIYYMSSANAAKENKVQSVTDYLISKRGKKEELNTKTFDAQGRIVQLNRKNSKEVYTYSDTLLTEVTTTTKRSTTKRTYEYDQEDRMIASKYYKDDKLVSAFRFEYFDQIRRTLVEHTVYKRKTTVSALKTSYDELLKKPTAAVFTVNGEVKKTWNYDCKEKGELVKSSTEVVSSQCKFQQENNDGSYSVFIRSIEQGKTYLTQTDFSKDSIFISQHKYFNDTVLVEETVKNGKNYSYKYYSEKGKFQRKYEATYDEFGNQLGFMNYNRRNKLIYYTKATYNTQHLVTEVESGKKWKHTFEYTFQN